MKNFASMALLFALGGCGGSEAPPPTLPVGTWEFRALPIVEGKDLTGIAENDAACDRLACNFVESPHKVDEAALKAGKLSREWFGQMNAATDELDCRSRNVEITAGKLTGEFVCHHPEEGTSQAHDEISRLEGTFDSKSFRGRVKLSTEYSDGTSSEGAAMEQSVEARLINPAT